MPHQRIKYQSGGSGDSPGIPELGHISPIHEQTIHEDVEIKLYEGSDNDKDKKQLVMKLIQSGLSKNRYYYSKKVAESIADHILKRPQMYRDHGYGWFGRSFKELVAIATESYKKKGGAYAIVDFTKNPETIWLYDLAEDHPEQLGASIDAHAKVREATARDGRLWGQDNFDPDKEGTPSHYIVEEIVFLNSVDFVTYASAGGGVVELMASQLPPEAMMKEFSGLMEGFQQRVNEMMLNSNNEESTEEADMKIEELTLSELKSKRPDLVESLETDFSSDAEAEARAQAKENELKEGYETKLTESATALKDTEKERDELKVKVEEADAKEAIATRREKVMGLITASDLKKSQISDVFVKDLLVLEDDKDIQARIDDRLNLAKVTESDESEEDEDTGDNGQRSTQSVEEDEDTPAFDASKLIKEVKSNKRRR